jgi:large subunit ribosomal protein L9
VKIALHPEVAVTVKVNVARSPEEADLQAQGIDVLEQMFEEEAAPVVAEELAAAEAEETAEPAANETAQTAAEETAEPPAEEGEQQEG